MYRDYRFLLCVCFALGVIFAVLGLLKTPATYAEKELETVSGE